MRLCRFDDNRLGLVDGNDVRDVSGVLDALPSSRWPLPPGDLLIAHLDTLRPRIVEAARTARALPLRAITLRSPVANPTKIIGAPVNYQKHIDESNADPNINFGTHVKAIDHYGLFLKATSALVGAGEGVRLTFPDRRNDHEIELAVVIGRGGRHIARARALDHVAGYSIGLDMTVRGTEDRSFRKSLDTYAVLGPWLVTRDEVADPNALDMRLTVNGETRQDTNTRYLIFDVQRLVEYASAAYTLYPGDIIMTGTPEGVGPVEPGDTMHAEIQSVGAMDVRILA